MKDEPKEVGFFYISVYSDGTIDYSYSRQLDLNTRIAMLQNVLGEELKVFLDMMEKDSDGQLRS